jgi:hypothetical protein
MAPAVVLHTRCVAEGATAGAGHDGRLQEQGQSVIHRLGLSEQMDDVDVGRRLDLLLEDLARLRMVSGVATDPAPLDSLAERGAHHGVNAMDACGRQRRAVPAVLVVTRRPGCTRSVMRARRALALLAAAARAMLGARCERAKPVRASTAASGELGVQDVEGCAW